MAFLDSMLERFFRLTQPDRDQTARDLEKILRESNFKFLVSLLAQKTPAERQAFTQNLNHLLPHQAFQQIISEMALIQDEYEPSRPQSQSQSPVIKRPISDTLQRLLSFTKAAKNLDRYRPDGKTMLVTLERGYLIHVDFSGLGTEAKGVHPAIIWDAVPQRDHVVVIPCTSFKPSSTVEAENKFNIGPMKFLGANQTVNGALSVETVVQLDQIQPVSRKRILGHRTFNPASGQLEIAKIDSFQDERIKEGLRIYQLGEQSLYQAEILQNSNRIPFSPQHDVQFRHLNRQYSIVSRDSNQITYTVHGDSNQYQILMNPSNVSEKDRLSKLYTWTHAKGTQSRSYAHSVLQTFVQQQSTPAP